MAENVVINIEANTQGLESTIQLLTKLGVIEQKIADDFAKANTANVAQLNKGVAETAKSFDKLATSVKSVKADNGLAKALDVAAPAAKAGQAVMSLKAQLKEATAQAQLFADKYGELDARTLKAAAAASELRQKIEDTNRVIKALDPGEKFNTIKNLGASIGGIFQVATGSLQAFGVENERATKLAQQFQGALNIFAGAQQLLELKDTFIALQAAMGLTTVATEGTAAALGVEAVAAEGATVATKGFSTALTASGIGTIVVVLGTLVGIYLEIMENADEAAKSTKKLKQSTDDLAAARKGLRDAINDEQDAELSLKVTRGEITQAEKDRIILQRKSLEEYRKNVFDENILDIRRKRAKEDLDAAQAKFDERLQKSGRVDLVLKKAVDDAEKTLKQSEDAYQASVNKRVKTDESYRKQFQNSKEQEVNAAKAAESKKQEAAAKTTTVPKDKNAELKKMYDDAVRINKAYWDDLELQALSSGKSQEMIDGMIADNRIQQLRDSIDTAKLYNQEYVQFEIELQKLLNKQTTAPADKPTTPTTKTAISTAVSTMPKEIQDRLDLLDQVKQQFQDESIKAATDTLDAYFQTFIDGATMATDAQLAAIDVEEKSLQESYDRRLIGKREFDIQEKQLNDKKDALEKQRKRQQAAAEKEKALFDIAVNTATAIIKAWINPGFPLAPGTIATILATAGIQAAAVLAQPIPKFKTGTLAVGGTGTEDSIHAMLQPGEAVIPTETNKKYHPAIAAIYHNKIKAEDINSWVNMRLKGDYTADGGRSMTARMDTADMYHLGRIIKKNDGVYIKNIDELAGIFASLHNPRR